jgi:hypothetical protein
MRTHRNLLLLNFVVTEKETDNWFYVDYSNLKKYCTRKELISIVKAVKSNPKAYSDTGVNYIITENSPAIHSIQWSY